MKTSNISKPALDPSFFKPSLLWTWLNIGYGLGMFLVFAWLNYHVATGELPDLLKILIMTVSSTLAGIGLYVLAALGHDGLHGNLFKNEKLSLVTGLFFSASVLTYIDMGFVVRHWDHHRYTNQANDPDIYPTAMLTSWWQRLLLSRVMFNLVYLKNAFYMAIGKNEHVSQYRTPLSPAQLTFYSRLNFLFSAIWIAAYIAITVYNWRAGLYGILLPSLILALIAGCQSYLDHAGLGEEQFMNSYSRTSPFMSLIYFGSNYHLEHHLYPSVPGYRLPKVHRMLVKSGVYDEVKPPILHGLIDAYKTLTLPASPIAVSELMGTEPFTQSNKHGLIN